MENRKIHTPRLNNIFLYYVTYFSWHWIFIKSKNKFNPRNDMKTNLPQTSTISGFCGIRDICSLRRRRDNAWDTELKSENITIYENKIIRKKVYLFMYHLLIGILILESLIDCVFCNKFNNCHRLYYIMSIR